MFPATVDARAGAAASTVAAGIHDGGEVGGRPVAVDVHGVRSVDGFQAMVQGDGGGVHFGEHGVAFQDSFAVPVGERVS